MVEELLEQNPDQINAYSPDGFTALGLAAFFGHYTLAECLLNSGADANRAANSSFKVTPLHSACAVSNLEMAKLLIAHGADVNAKQMSGVAPLHSAAHNGQLELTSFLLENGADAYAKMEDGLTPLDMAEEGKHLEVEKVIRQYLNSNE